MPMRPLLALFCFALATVAPAQQCADTALPPPPTLRDRGDVLGVVFPGSVSQGAMVVGKVPAGSKVRYGNRELRVTPYGSVVFGVGRDATGPLQVQVQAPNAPVREISIAVTPRDWPIERINGVPPATVNPPKAIAERIEREQARVVAVRSRDDARTGFAQTFSDYKKMLDETQPDAVYVLMPPYHLFDLSVECLNRGHGVFVEKPLGVTSGQARNLARLAEKNNCSSLIIYCLD